MTRAAVGVLALQGGVAPHARAFQRLGLAVREVRSPADLAAIDHLVLPGGESTTIRHLLLLNDLWDAIPRRHREGSLELFGTCAGAILLGKGDGERPERLGLIDVVLQRNAYGRQVDSFRAALDASPALGGGRLPAVFIRAPRIVAVGPGVEVLARHQGEPVLVRQGRVLAATFHPELTDDLRVHALFAGVAKAAACPA